MMIAFTATTDSDETTPTAALATTVSQQTSTTGSSSSAVMDDTTTATDSQTDTGIYIYMTYVICWHFGVDEGNAYRPYKKLLSIVL